MIERTRSLAVNESVVAAELDEEMVLLNVETGIYYGLDPVGTRIWSLLAAGAAEEEIIARLGNEYEAEGSQIRADVGEFLGALAARGLVRDADG